MNTPVIGKEHWLNKGDVRLFVWQKKCETSAPFLGTILFIHGSSMASQPTFDLTVPNRPDSSVMDWFAQRGFDTWCCDMEGYGRSTKSRLINCDIANGVDDLEVVSEYIMKSSGAKDLMLYGISSGSLRAASFAEKFPERVNKLVLDAFVWTGEGSPTLEQRKKNLPKFIAANRRPIDRPFVFSVFERDHPDTADQNTINAFADAILALDDSMPTGTYVDMCSRLPLVNPQKITNSTLILRGEFDGIASMEDLINFFQLLPNPDKQFIVMPGISHASFQQKNYLSVYHYLYSFYTQPTPVYLSH
jgi:pimeloyl-ACP methyl ester carboxylesterase